MAKALRHIRETATKWHVRFHDRKRSPSEVTFSFDKASFSTRQIERKRDELRYLWQNGDWDPWTKRLPGDDGPQYVTLRGAVDAYCAHKRLLGQRGLKGGWNARTYSNYRVNLLAFAEDMGNQRPVSALTTKDLDRWIYRDDLAEASRQTYRRQLGTLIDWLAEMGYASLDLPIAPVKQHTIPEFVTLSELESIVEAHVDLCKFKMGKKHASSHNNRLWMGDLFRFAFFQPQRQGEIAELTVPRVNLDTRQMRIGDSTFRTKGRREHFVRITDEALPIITTFYDETNRTGRKRIFRTTGKTHGNAFRAAARIAFPDREGLHYHSLRHSGAIHRLKSGWDIYDVSRLLTHATVKTTEFYLAALDNEERRRFGYK